MGYVIILRLGRGKYDGSLFLPPYCTFPKYFGTLVTLGFHREEMEGRKNVLKSRDRITFKKKRITCFTFHLLFSPASPYHRWRTGFR